MSVSKKAMIEARKARVPLSRVALELRRSDKRIRARVAGAGVLLLTLLTAAGSLLLYHRPLEAVLAVQDARTAGQIEDAAVLDTVRIVTAPEPAATPEAGERGKSVIDLGGKGEAPQLVASIRSEPDRAAIVDQSPPQRIFIEPSSTGAFGEASRPAAAAFSNETASLQTPNVDMNAPRILNDKPETKVSAANSAPPVGSDITERVQIVAAAPVRDISEILQPKDDSDCNQGLKALAEKTTIYFALSSVIVPPEDSAKLKSFLAAVKNCPSVRIDVGGHTDKTGEQLLNLQMSWQRAENVIKSLQLMGADVTQFSPVGFSSTRPLYSEQTGLAQAKNRRVEFNLR